MEDVCVIMPTVRNYDVLRIYFDNARNHNFDLSRIHVIIVTEDFCDKDVMERMLKEEGINGTVFNQKDRDAWLQENDIPLDIIPKKSHAETSFGLLWMWKNKNFEYGFFLDDDTAPARGDFFGTHIKNLGFSGEMECVSSDKKWVNVLYQNFSRHKCYPRGYPYSCMNEKNHVIKKQVKNVVASQGLWMNIPDLDAIRILMQGDLMGRSVVQTIREDFKHNFVVEKDNYLTVCSMNLAFRREIIPAFYQYPMDDNEWKIGRFDDIWSGVALKKACDILGKEIVNTFPLCDHNKAERSTFKDIMAEAPALELNEYLWQIFDSIEFKSKDYNGIFLEMAAHLKNGEWKQYKNGDFLNFIGEKMESWVQTIKKLGE